MNRYKRARAEAIADFEARYVMARAEAIADFEARYVMNARDEAGGNVSQAAAEHGINRVYFHRLLRKHAERIERLRDEVFADAECVEQGGVNRLQDRCVAPPEYCVAPPEDDSPYPRTVCKPVDERDA